MKITLNHSIVQRIRARDNHAETSAPDNPAIPRQHSWVLWSEILVSWVILLGLLYYTSLELIRAPYLGFHFDGSSGLVSEIYVAQEGTDLEVGDRLVAVNGQDYAEWLTHFDMALFAGADAGDVLTLIIERANAPRPNAFAVRWPVVGLNQAEFVHRVFNLWWVGYVYWGAGLATLLFVRPRDSKRTLLVAFFFLTAIWLVAGNTSRWGHGDSRILSRAALCLLVPVMLHLHWLFPSSLGRLPRWLVWGSYGVAFIFCVSCWTPWATRSAAMVAFGGATLGSLGLLIAHYMRQPEVRSQVRFLFYALLLAVFPLVTLSVAVSFGLFPSVAAFALLALPIIPGAYFFSIYRFQLGGSEFRANRLIAVYLYLVGIGTLLVIVGAALSVEPAMRARAALWSTALGLLVALGTLYLFPRFQQFVERRLLAMPLSPMSLVQTYLARITTTLNEECLAHLLKNEVLPTLFIRQSALLRIRNQEAVTLYSTNAELPPEVLHHFVEQLKHIPVYRTKCEMVEGHATWVRLALAFQVEGKLIGLWLLGRHDPDDLYSPDEVATLQTLAHQTALALSNIDQAAQLQALNQANIERQEQERITMAHFLHDAILNQAAVLYMSVEQEDVTPRVEEAYATLKGQIHQMVSSLRPPSLDLGLAAALEELTSELDQRNHVRFHLALKGQEAAVAPAAVVPATVTPLITTPTVAALVGTGVETEQGASMRALGMQSDGLHYPTHVENQLFRIVQQACENAFRHAQAAKICIFGSLTPTMVDLTVADDGVGFVVGKPLELSHLLARKQFGLVHMLERAEYIGAELTLESAPGEGTRVRVVWAARG